MSVFAEGPNYEIHHGNCLPYLDNWIEDGREFDLVIADPPYDDSRLINESIEACRLLCRGISLFFMYAENLCDLKVKPDQVLFWTKPISTKNTSRKHSRFVEVIAVYDLQRGRLNSETHWSSRAGIFTDSLINQPIHPYEKPLSLIERLIATHLPNARVLDPFMGSGTTLEATKRLGLHGTGIDIDRNWCQTALSRLESKS